MTDHKWEGIHSRWGIIFGVTRCVVCNKVATKKNHNLTNDCSSPQLIDLPCLFCGKVHRVPMDSNEATGVFNVFCPNGECEDRYAARL